MLRSTVCRYEHFLQPWYQRWAERFEGVPLSVSPTTPISYRKVWEWAAILQALDERGMLGRGRRGLGFAVGREPLTSVMASLGTQILATDAPDAATIDAWHETGQHAASADALFHPHAIERPDFDRLVAFQPADMRALAPLADAAPFDFLWSSCAFEHLGELESGLRFVIDAMDLLKPGGIAVHTTEFNISSNDETLAVGPDCIYRRRDLEDLDRRLRPKRCGLEPLDFDPGTHPYDLDYDVAPFYETGRVAI